MKRKKHDQLWGGDGRVKGKAFNPGWHRLTLLTRMPEHASDFFIHVVRSTNDQNLRALRKLVAVHEKKRHQIGAAAGGLIR
jgi:hypothetical protein